MSFYLLDHPPASRQFYDNRLVPWAGAIGVHTTESALDRIAPDTGDINIARFISNRPDPGSYIGIDDTDSSIELVPWSYTTFSIGVKGKPYNSHTYSRAFACRTTDLDIASGATHVMFARFAENVVRDLRAAGLDPVRSARWITGAQALDGEPGLFNHGDVQGDRSDAFSKHPQRAELERLLVESILLAAGAKPPAVAPPRKVSQRMFTIEAKDGRLHEFRVLADGSIEFRWETPAAGVGVFEAPARFEDFQLQGSPKGLAFDSITGYLARDGRITLHATHCASPNWWWCQESAPGRKFTPWGQF